MYCKASFINNSKSYKTSEKEVKIRGAEMVVVLMVATSLDQHAGLLLFR